MTKINGTDVKFGGPRSRVAIFIDGSNLYAASRSLDKDIDYRRMSDFFTNGLGMDVRRAYYYSALLDTDEYSPLKPLTDWLSYNGYYLVTKPAREFTDASGRRRVKGNMDVDVAVNMMEMAPHIDHAILFSGDSDFRALLEAVQRKGVFTTVVSTIKSSPPMIADDLRRQCDQFVDLDSIIDHFQRNPADKPARD